MFVYLFIFFKQQKPQCDEKKTKYHKGPRRGRSRYILCASFGGGAKLSPFPRFSLAFFNHNQTTVCTAVAVHCVAKRLVISKRGRVSSSSGVI